MNKVETTFTKIISKRAGRFVALALLGALAIGPALADERGHDNRSERGQDNRRDKGHDNRSDKGYDKRNQKHEQGENRRGDRDQARFSDRHRQYAREYYDNRKRRGRYRKEENRRYEVGRRLSRDVIFYEVPRSVAREFGQPPRGYRYVRVSNDILLISAITGLVIDALRN